MDPKFQNKLSLQIRDAVEKNDLNFLKRLLEGNECEYRSLKGALVTAAEAGNEDVVQLLLDHVESGQLTAALELVFRTAAEAAKKGTFASVAAAINLDGRSVRAQALCWAAEHGRNELIAPLLDSGADVNSTEGRYGDTALSVAAADGQVDCLTTLIEHGADVNAKASGWTPLHRATLCGRTECVTALLRHGADVNAGGPRNVTPLHWAAAYGRTECVTTLVQHGADVNSRDSRGNTPLHDASKSGHADCYEKLVQSGADTTLINNDNKTALDVADVSPEKHMQRIVENQAASGSQVQQMTADISDVMKTQTDMKPHEDDVTNRTTHL